MRTEHEPIRGLSPLHKMQAENKLREKGMKIRGQCHPQRLCEMVAKCIGQELPKDIDDRIRMVMRFLQVEHRPERKLDFRPLRPQRLAPFAEERMRQFREIQSLYH